MMACPTVNLKTFCVNYDDAVDNDEKSGIFLEQYYIIKTSYSEYIIKTSAFLKLVDSPDIEPKEL